MIPLGASADLYDVGGSGSLEARLPLPSLAPFFPYVEVGYGLIPTPADKSLSLLSSGAGAGFQHHASPRVILMASAGGGYYSATWGDDSAARFYLRGRADAAYRFSPTFSLALGGAYTRYLGPSEALYQGVGVALTGAINLGALRGGSNIEAPSVKLDPVFPIFHTHYDKNPFGSVTIVNREDGDIQNVKVSVHVKQYMDQPKVCATYPSIERGAGRSRPRLYALFTDADPAADREHQGLGGDHRRLPFLGSQRQARSATAADSPPQRHELGRRPQGRRIRLRQGPCRSCVSPSSPPASSASRASAEIDQNLRFAMGLFERAKALRPRLRHRSETPYKELSANKGPLDSLQFPHQTLVYRGGDCDDMSIIYSAVLEAVGIKTAFITIPGHIFMAFALNMNEETARATFMNPDELIFAEGSAWVPVEVTLLNEGFTKAWAIGARQWQDNVKTSTAELIGVASAWERYEPVGVPGEDTRIVLPEADEVVRAYNTSLARFIDRKSTPRADKLRGEIRMGGGALPSSTSSASCMRATACSPRPGPSSSGPPGPATPRP